MSSKPKQQQANLFSFFKKSDKALETPAEKKVPDNASPAPASTAKSTITPSSSVVNSAEKPNAVPESKAVKVTPESAEKTKHDDGLSDSDESFTLGKRQRLRKGGESEPPKDSAVKSNKITPLKTPPASSQKTPKKRKYEDSDEDASLSADDDSSMDVDSDDEDDDEDNEPSSEEEEAPKRRRKAEPAPKAAVKKTAPAKMKTPTRSLVMVTPSAISPDPNTPSTPSASTLALPEGVLGAGRHEHDDYSFLKPEHIKDADQRRPNDPHYNPRTLYIPPSFLKEQTPAMAQWWAFKAQAMDTVLFFKVGKFYELFHMDADIGFRHLDLIYMKGNKAHSGFPELSYGRHAARLVALGYKVARVEQTETPEMLAQRNKTSAKKDKVVTRELCSILSKGTLTFGVLDDANLWEAAPRSLALCVCEGEDGRLGVCAADPALSRVILGEFLDTRQRTRLRRFLAQYPATEMVMLEGCLTPRVEQLLMELCPEAVREDIRTVQCQEGPQSAGETLGQLHRGRYFAAEQSAVHQTADTQNYWQHWPEVLRRLAESYHQQRTTLTPPAAVSFGERPASKQAQAESAEGEQAPGALALRALGGIIWVLRRSVIDEEVLKTASFHAFIPPDDGDEEEEGEEEGQEGEEMEVEREQRPEETFFTQSLLQGDDTVSAAASADAQAWKPSRIEFTPQSHSNRPDVRRGRGRRLCAAACSSRPCSGP